MRRLLSRLMISSSEAAMWTTIRWSRSLSRTCACVERAGKAVEQEPAASVSRARQALGDQARDQLVADQRPAGDRRRHLAPERRVVADRLAQDVAGRDVRHAVAPGEPHGLRALSRTGRTDQNEVERRHRSNTNSKLQLPRHSQLPRPKSTANGNQLPWELSSWEFLGTWSWSLGIDMAPYLSACLIAASASGAMIA